ncbi:uncharacterized protein LOC125957707 isoform X2 [Anopheles darlingi]|uniref:uncharacterized protein LOC125957707 isoform X2 n=1 Tax=Anopheles darlingi TaxID=43151 RepID=UPI0021003655|nr:uncharacterized protein LOC125957707 isoform X2 [Anopheles darlingi]
MSIISIERHRRAAPNRTVATSGDTDAHQHHHHHHLHRPLTKLPPSMGVDPQPSSTQCQWQQQPMVVAMVAVATATNRQRQPWRAAAAAAAGLADSATANHHHHHHNHHHLLHHLPPPPPPKVPPLAPPTPGLGHKRQNGRPPLVGVVAGPERVARGGDGCVRDDGNDDAGDSDRASPAAQRPRKVLRSTRGYGDVTVTATAKLALLLIMVLIAVIDHSEAGTCWLRRSNASGKCSQLFARNVTRESCCSGGAGKGFSEKDITDVTLFFINAFNDGMACSSCLAQDSCERAKCGPNKRCVMRHNRPKCICAPTCTKQLQRGPKRPKGHRLQNVATMPPTPAPTPPAPDRGELDEQLMGINSPHQHHRQNIKVINLSESQRNRRQYFADDGGRRRAPFAVSPRQLRFTDTAASPATAGRRNVKKSSDLSDQRQRGSAPASKSQRGGHGRAWKGAKQQPPPTADDTDVERKHNLLESVTLAGSGKGGGNGDSNHSSRSTGNGAGSSHQHQHESRKQSRPIAGTTVATNCTSSFSSGTATQEWSGRTGCPAPSNWTGGERLVLLQSIDPRSSPAPALGGRNGTTAGRRGGSRRRADLQMPSTTTTTMASGRAPGEGVTRRHHKKLVATTGNRAVVAGNGTRYTGITGSGQPAKPFVAFGKPKLLRVPKEPRRGSKQNGTVGLRVPRREPQYLDEVFVVDNHHHFRRAEHRMPMDDILGNEIMLHTGFYNPVCGTDGKTYKTECQLKKRACRQELTSLMVAYKGHCQTSCKFVKCPNDQQCIEDQNATPHCVTCAIAGDCRGVDRSPKSMVCGTDGITYPNVCELKRQACLIGRAIPVAYRGRCNGAPKSLLSKRQNCNGCSDRDAMDGCISILLSGVSKAPVYKLKAARDSSRGGRGGGSGDRG